MLSNRDKNSLYVTAELEHRRAASILEQAKTLSDLAYKKMLKIQVASRKLQDVIVQNLNDKIILDYYYKFRRAVR